MNILVIKCGGSIINELSESCFNSVKDVTARGALRTTGRKNTL